jgi:pimeloyl-ACP methyl ester carboxylesterase
MRRWIPFSIVMATLAGGSATAEEMRAETDTVVLLHGMGRTPLSMKRLGGRLGKQGFRVVNFGYPSTRQPVETHAAGLREHLAALPDSGQGRIHFVTHSLGGIVVRALLKDSPPPNLGRVVMLSPPNQGCELADRFSRNPVIRLFWGPAGAQLGTDESSLPNRLGPVEFELGIIAGNRSLNPLLSAWIPGPDDGTVSVRRAAVAGMRDFLVVPASHTFIMRRASVARQVGWFLQHGQFHRESKPVTG